jgi:hypothetical protein
MSVHDLHPAPPGRSSVAMSGQAMPKPLAAGNDRPARQPQTASRPRPCWDTQSRIRRDTRPKPAPCLPTHRYSCPMTAGHPPQDHDGGRRYAQSRRLESLNDHNCGMAPVAHHAAFRRQPDRARRYTPCARPSARWQGSPLPSTARPEAAQFRFGRLTRTVLPSSGFLMLGESDEISPYAYGSP